MFTHLHVHSEYSLLDGMCNIKKLIPYVDSLGQTAVAVTDHGVLHAAINFYLASLDYEQKTGKKIKPIFGLEAYITPFMNDHLFVKESIATLKEIKKKTKPKDRKNLDFPIKVNEFFNYLAEKNEEYYGNSTQLISEDVEGNEQDKYRYGLSHLVLLAKNNEGFENLMKIASASQIYGFYNKPRCDHDLLSKYGKGIIALSACRAGEIPRLILRHEEEAAKKLIHFYKNIFDEFYLELQPPEVEEQTYINSVLIELSKETDTPLVVTSDAHYLKAEDAIAHENLMKMQTGGKFWFKEQCYYLHTEEELLSYGLPKEAIQNTNIIAEKCNVTFDTKTKLPEIELSEGYNSNTYITQKCQEGLMDYFSKNECNEEEYLKRLNFELDIITQKDLSDYLLLIADIIDYAKRNKLLIGPGRGSSGGSLVCMCLGITNIDPIKYNLLFERRMLRSLNRVNCWKLPMGQSAANPTRNSWQVQRLVAYYQNGNEATTSARN